MAERGRAGGVGAPPNGAAVARREISAYVLSWIGAYVLSWVAGGSGGQAASGSLSEELSMSWRNYWAADTPAACVKEVFLL